jgi:hypothetical protein
LKLGKKLATENTEITEKNGFNSEQLVLLVEARKESDYSSLSVFSVA